MTNHLDPLWARYQRAESLLRWPMLALSLALVPVLVIQLAARHLSGAEQAALDTADIAIWAAFAAEYAVLLWLAPQRRRFVRTHVPELLLVVIPVLRPLRVVRALRAVQVLRLGSASAASLHLGRRSLARRTVTYVAVTAAVLLLVCSVLVLTAERGHPGSNIRTFGDALWWASVTVTTIGYGDHYPVTAVGRLIATVLSISGLALVGTVTAAVAAWFVRASEQEQFAAEEAEHEVQLEELADADIDIRDVHRQLATLTGAVEQLAANLNELRRGQSPNEPSMPRQTARLDQPLDA